ncbi:MAG TPA: hypothetical protein VFH61_08565 [Thermoleophilia bacterium]|nr:hypothetical protein [Thermoleophilia bacterium]
MDTSHPKMQGLIDRLKKDPKVRDAEGLAAYIVRRCGKKQGKMEDVDMDLAESIARFRQLSEAVKVGDYVSAVDGTAGFVDEVSDGRASYTWRSKNDTKREWRPVAQLTVNPGGPPR